MFVVRVHWHAPRRCSNAPNRQPNPTYMIIDHADRGLRSGLHNVTRLGPSSRCNLSLLFNQLHLGRTSLHVANEQRPKLSRARALSWTPRPPDPVEVVAYDDPGMTYSDRSCIRGVVRNLARSSKEKGKKCGGYEMRLVGHNGVLSEKIP